MCLLLLAKVEDDAALARGILGQAYFQPGTREKHLQPVGKVIDGALEGDPGGALAHVGGLVLPAAAVTQAALDLGELLLAGAFEDYDEHLFGLGQHFLGCFSPGQLVLDLGLEFSGQLPGQHFAAFDDEVYAAGLKWQ